MTSLSFLAALSMTDLCAGFATKAAVKKTCFLPVNVPEPSGLFIGAVSNIGYRLRIPLTVNSATSGLQLSANLGRWLRSVNGAHPQKLSFNDNLGQLLVEVSK